MDISILGISRLSTSAGCSPWFFQDLPAKRETNDCTAHWFLQATSGRIQSQSITRIYIYIHLLIHIWIALLCVVECRILWFYVLKVSLSFELQFADLQKPQLQRCREWEREWYAIALVGWKTVLRTQKHSTVIQGTQIVWSQRGSVPPFHCVVWPRKTVKKVKSTVEKKAPKLRKNIQPGQILILLASKFRGKRVVFLKQLGEWPALGHRSLCPQWCAIEASEPAILHRH